MWARVIEMLLGCWLLASPFIVGVGASIYFVSGVAVIGLGLLSFWPRTSWAHFLTLLPAVVLIAVGYSAGHPAPPSAQNQIVVGILLGMFAIIPNHTNQMPAAWQRYYKRQL